MEQIKVVFNSEIKRITLPNTFSDLVLFLKSLYNIPERFSVFYFDSEGNKHFVNENNFQGFKEKVKNSQSTLKLNIGPEQKEEIVEYSFANDEEQNKKKNFPDAFFEKIQSNLDSGYSNLVKLYEEAKMPELVENVKTKGSDILNKMSNKLGEFIDYARGGENNNPQAKEIRYEPQYFKELNLIKNSFSVNKTDQEILSALNKNHGDIDKSLSDLFD